MTLGFNTYILGARLIYWLYLWITLVCAFGVYLWWNREFIRQKYYEIRFPERIILISIIYPGNWIKRFYRLIPNRDTFSFGGEEYLYNDAAILKNNNWYTTTDKKDKLIARIPDLSGAGEKEYFIDDYLKLKKKGRSYPELWFKDGCPFPIDFQKSEQVSGLKINTQGLSKLHNSTTINQIYSSIAESGIIIVVLILTALGFLINLAVFSKLMGWLK